MSGRPRIVVGFGVSVLLVAFLLWEIDLGRVVAVLGRSRVQLLPLILLPFAVDVSLRTVRWHVLLAREPRPGYRGTFAYLVIGYLANNILPMRLGELVRAHLLGRREGVGRSRALGSIAMERTLDVISAAAVGAVACAASGVHGAIVVTLALVALGAGGIVAVVALVPHELVRRTIDGLVARAPAGPSALVAGIAGRFLHALLDAAAPGRVLAALVLSVAAWLVTSGLFAVTAACLGISLPVAGLVAVAVAANIGAALPSAPAAIGPFEVGVVVIATALGVDAPTALAFAILSHMCTVVPASLAGGLELSRMRWGLDTLRAASRGDGAAGEVEPA
ncbi:MAG: lysylphosphatidylglycerol synthase transmembrane domain-containing protein [Candidatus Limnocylindrales bacterium]